MLTAKMKGRRIGRQKGEAVETKKARASKPLIRDLARRYGGQYTAEQVMRMCGISRNTYFAYCQEIDAEIEREDAEAGDHVIARRPPRGQVPTPMRSGGVGSACGHCRGATDPRRTPGILRQAYAPCT